VGAEHADLVDYLPPDGGALCCLRLSRSRFDEAAVQRFYDTCPSFDCRVAPGSWFGEQDRVFRLGFGYLPEETFSPALEALRNALTAAVHPRTH
jgi:DNA-binding transcriptional MocR family regulator